MEDSFIVIKGSLAKSVITDLLTFDKSDEVVRDVPQDTHYDRAHKEGQPLAEYREVKHEGTFTAIGFALSTCVAYETQEDEIVDEGTSHHHHVLPPARVAADFRVLDNIDTDRSSSNINEVRPVEQRQAGQDSVNEEAGLSYRFPWYVLALNSSSVSYLPRHASKQLASSQFLFVVFMITSLHFLILSSQLLIDIVVDVLSIKQDSAKWSGELL